MLNTLARLLGRERRDRQPTRLVRWIGRRPPADRFERWVAQELAEPAEVPFHLVVEGVALRWLYEEIRHGAWAIDIGGWGPQLLTHEVSVALERLNGDLVLIKEGDTVKQTQTPVELRPAISRIDAAEGTCRQSFVGVHPWC